MDELLHHCLRELSFDGDLGCDVSRLRDFITEFYVHNDIPQTPDDAFCAFVWSLVVQQPTVRVGIAPPGVTSKVWIAPQISAKRKAKAKGQEHIETKPFELSMVLGAQHRTLDEMKREYGDKLRIAVDPDAIYAAITGSHIRFAKLSPMVYSALQVITRGRDNGITVVELGQQSKYDQKTCFYLVKQLTDLNLVVKVRRGGVGTHFCIHRYFFDRSPSWKAIRDEETKAEDSRNAIQIQTSNILEEENKDADIQPLKFSPIDARHLSSLPLIRGRVVRLLKASKNQMYASNNMLITLGFSNPTKTDRRFFQSRIREMIQQGLIEKVIVPSNKKKSAGASVKCFRLIVKDRHEKLDGDSIVIEPQDGDDDEKDAIEQLGVKTNITIHKQIFNLLEESGVAGMTLNELSIALCQFDKRTIELLLTRAEKFPPPSHLGDLGIAGLMETSGRERRHRYFTTSAYRELISKENLDNSTLDCAPIDLSNVGGFLPIDPQLFYEDQQALFKFQDSFKNVERAGGKSRKRTLKNPVLADGSIKQGRPRKHPVGEGAELQHKQTKKRKRSNAASHNFRSINSSEGEDPPSKRKRTEEKTDSKERGPAVNAKQNDAEKTPKRARVLKAGLGARNDETSSPVSSHPGRLLEINLDSSRETGSMSITLTRLPIQKQVSAKLTTVEIPKRAVTPSNMPSPKRMRVCLPDSILGPPLFGASANDISLDEGTNQQTITGEPVFDTNESLFAPQILLADPDVASDAAPTGLDPSQSIPIDPALMTDVLEYTQKILNDSPTVSPGSPLTPLSDQLFPEIQNHIYTSTPERFVPEKEQLLMAEPMRERSTKHRAEQMDKKISRETRVNVSHLRRENELYRVVENLGGIVNIQTKDFFEEHMTLLESMTKAGEATSAPAGTRTDKRTVVTTFNNLEKRGRIKQLKTVIITHTGLRRPACIVYLPTIGQDQLNAFLADLASVNHASPHQGSFVKIDERVEYGSNHTSLARGALPLQLLQVEQPGANGKERWSKNIARANQLFSYEDSIIREVLLMERTTVAQLYGFIVGKAVRCRELHLSTLGAFEEKNPSCLIISHDQRIIDVSFFCYDIPLDLYCSLISALSYDEELTQFIATENGRRTLVRDIPANLNAALRIGRSRARSRFLDILETLRALKLVTPLQVSTSDTPWITCTPANDRPNAFDIASLDGRTASNPIVAPVYWHFNDIAPIHAWAVSETAPPFWRTAAVHSVADGVNFWQLLEKASLNTDSVNLENSTSTPDPPAAEINIARSLRRRVSWNPSYILTWHQMQYIRQFTEVSTAKTPLQDEDGGAAQIERVSWVTSAPQVSVRNFFQATREKLLEGLEKMRKKSEQQTANKQIKRAATTQASLAKKAADARSQRENDWTAMMLRLHLSALKAGAAARVNIVRTRFLQAGSIKNIGKWEAEVVDAVREADIVTKNFLKVPHKRSFIAQTAPVPLNIPLAIAVNPPEKPVETLVSLQGPTVVSPPPKVKRKRKGKDAEDDLVESKPKALRRHRFQWNRDYEELARDASAIIKARCRNLPRLDWAAFEQVFPAVPRNTVRQRLAHIRETPGNEAYLNRLEDRWYNLWMEHRGTTLLPDDDPISASNFNLIKHIEFLRQHVDKNALRVGFAQPKERASNIIPSSVSQLLDQFDILETTPAAPPWDFVWNAVVEEGREKKMLNQPFLRTVEDMPFIGQPSSEAISLAEAAVKMTLGTPHERYDPKSASMLLHSVGEHYVSSATKNLLGRGVLSKLVRDPQRQKPGRQLKISEMNQNAIGGSIPRETFQDATSLEDMPLQEGTWHEWPLLATDGDSAALIQLVSENKVDFKIDTIQAQLARLTLDWNSKKADDDQIETTIFIRTGLTPTPLRLIRSPELSPARISTGLRVEYITGHGQNIDESMACCRQLAGELVDCTGCLEDEWTSFNDSLTSEERKLATHILTIVRCGEGRGVTKCHLRRNTTMDVTSGQLFSIVKKMTESPVPMLFWTGYSRLVLVSSAYIKNWTVLVSERPVTRIFPRRWFDISGVKVVEFWEAALKAVMGVIVFRPGITQAELRWRLRSVYDKQEVGDIVQWLQDEGYLKMRCDPMIVEEDKWDVRALDELEEKGVFWFIGDEKHWYQV